MAEIGLKLRNCPFCGKDRAKIYYPYYSTEYCVVQCYECYCTTALYRTPEQAAEAWNRREDNG